MAHGVSHRIGRRGAVERTDEHVLGVLDIDLLLHGRLDVGLRGEGAEQGLDLVHAQADRLLTAAAVGKRVQLGEVVRIEKGRGIGVDRRQSRNVGVGSVERGHKSRGIDHRIGVLECGDDVGIAVELAVRRAARRQHLGAEIGHVGRIVQVAHDLGEDLCEVRGLENSRKRNGFRIVAGQQVLDQVLAMLVDELHLVGDGVSHRIGRRGAVERGDELKLGVLNADLLLHSELDVSHRVEGAEQVLDRDHAETDRLLATATIGQLSQLGEGVRIAEKGGGVSVDRRQSLNVGVGSVEDRQNICVCNHISLRLSLE